MKLKRCSLYMMFGLLTSCAATPEPDGMCDALAQFANTADVGLTPSVEFKVDWGGQLLAPSTPDTIHWAAKNCQSFGNSASGTFCRYLIENSSSEFPIYNFRQMAMCLGAQYQSVFPSVSITQLDIQMSSTETIGVETGIVVNLSFSTATKTQPATIKLSAARE